jgi:hypothetical protein
MFSKWTLAAYPSCSCGQAQPVQYAACGLSSLDESHLQTLYQPELRPQSQQSGHPEVGCREVGLVIVWLPLFYKWLLDT